MQAEPRDLAKIISFYETADFAVKTFSQAYQDIQLVKNNKAPIYNLDFSLLAQELFGLPAKGAAQFMPTGQAVIQHIAHNRTDKELFLLAISGSVYYEFLDQLNHTIEQLQSLANHKIEIPEFNSEQDIDDLLGGDKFFQTSEDFRYSLQLLTNESFSDTLNEPARRLIEFIKSRQLHGLGDYLKPAVDSQHVRNLYNEIFEELVNLRLSRELTRSRESSLFHYKMDAANICLTKYCSIDRQSRTFFVTNNFANLKTCDTGNDMNCGRHHYVPLILKNIELMGANQNFYNGSAAYLDEGINAASRIRQKLQRYRDGKYGKLPKDVELEFWAFYERFYSPLSLTDSKRPSLESGDLTVAPRAIGFASVDVANRVDAAIEKVERMAKEVAQNTSELGLNLMEGFGLRDDPIVKKLTKRFVLD